MSENSCFHGDEAEQFSFFRIPRALMTDERFRGLSTDAKLLYGLMLDRMGLSLQNGWLDERNGVFIYFTLDNIQEALACGHNKAVRLLAELEKYALIERVKQGQGKPAKIYVKDFISIEEQDLQGDEQADLQKSENPTSGLPIFKCQHFPKGDGNYTDKNYTDLSYINQSINPKQPEPTSEHYQQPPRCQQDTPPPDSDAIGGAVRASMSFVKHKRPLLGASAPKTPIRFAFHRETHLLCDDESSQYQTGQPGTSYGQGRPVKGRVFPGGG